MPKINHQLEVVIVEELKVFDMLVVVYIDLEEPMVVLENLETKVVVKEGNDLLTKTKFMIEEMLSLL